MTLVVTSASSHGISVVADRAITRRDADGQRHVLSTTATKMWYREEANVAIAAWGSVSAPDGTNYETWLAEFAATELSRMAGPKEVADRLAVQLKTLLDPLSKKGWAPLRRGVHVSGFEGDLPVIYHVHTGPPEMNSWPKAFCDFPEIYGGGEAPYRASLAKGARAQLRNGYFELFDSVTTSVQPFRETLEYEYGVSIPAPTIRGQLLFDVAMVRLSGNLLAAAELLPAVSDAIDCVAFTRDGRVGAGSASTSALPLRPTPTMKAHHTASYTSAPVATP